MVQWMNFENVRRVCGQKTFERLWWYISLSQGLAMCKQGIEAQFGFKILRPVFIFFPHSFPLEIGLPPVIILIGMFHYKPTILGFSNCFLMVFLWFGVAPFPEPPPLAAAKNRFPGGCWTSQCGRMNWNHWVWASGWEGAMMSHGGSVNFPDVPIILQNFPYICTQYAP